MLKEVEGQTESTVELQRFRQSLQRWFIAFLATTIFAADLWNYLYVLAGIFTLGIWIWGCVLAARAISILVRNRPSKLPTLALAGLIGLAALDFTGFWTRVIVWPRFFIGWPSYQATIARINRAADSEAKKQSCTNRCRLELDENGAPQQVAFLVTGVDVLFGCDGFVYDYTRNMQNSGHKSIGGLPVLEARHLVGPWYVSHFWHD